MPSTNPQKGVLVAHSSTPNACVRALAAHMRHDESGTLTLEYALDADMARLRIPAGGSGARGDGLWKHTCFEAFVAVPGAPGYLELNFSPSREWAIYRFTAYREAMSPAQVTHPPEIAVRRFNERLELDTFVRLSDFPELQGARRLQLALTAVIEEDSGTLSYWALRHAPGKPDFHHRHGFALELEP